MIGDVLKNKNGTNTNQTFIIMTSEEDCVILFDNLSSGVVGDTTRGFSKDDYEVVNLRTFANFIVSNNF